MTKKKFDCIAFKNAAQATLLAETEGMTPEELCEHVRRKAEDGPLGEWWRRVKARSAMEPVSRRVDREAHELSAR